MVVLRDYYFVHFDVLFILGQQFLVGDFVGIKIFDDGLHVEQGNLCCFFVLIRFFEEGLEGVVVEEIGLDEILVVLKGHLILCL